MATISVDYAARRLRTLEAFSSIWVKCITSENPELEPFDALNVQNPFKIVILAATSHRRAAINAINVIIRLWRPRTVKLPDEKLTLRDTRAVTNHYLLILSLIEHQY